MQPRREPPVRAVHDGLRGHLRVLSDPSAAVAAAYAPATLATATIAAAAIAAAAAAATIAATALAPAQAAAVATYTIPTSAVPAAARSGIPGPARATAHAPVAAAAAADVRIQRHAWRQWQQHQRDQHVHRPARADAAAASHAAVATGTASGAAAAVASHSGWRVLSTFASDATAGPVVAATAARTSVAAVAVAAAAVGAAAAFPTDSAPGPAVLPVGVQPPAPSCVAGWLLSALPVCAAFAACYAPVPSLARSHAEVLSDCLRLQLGLRRGGRVHHQHDSKRRGGARQVQPSAVWRWCCRRPRFLRVCQPRRVASECRQHIHLRDDGDAGGGRAVPG